MTDELYLALKGN